MTKEEILTTKNWSSEYPNYMAESQIHEAMDEYYNQAIDDAIGILKGYFGADELMNHESLLPKLEALKKKI